MGKDCQQKVQEAVRELGEEPFSAKNAKRLHGELEGLCHYQLGKFRMIFRVLEEAKEVKILAIASRGDIHK
jgi:mRNA-degrading endonuclease RelE of RelBE toxin-antitoxin system